MAVLQYNLRMRRKEIHRLTTTSLHPLKSVTMVDFTGWNILPHHYLQGSSNV